MAATAESKKVSEISWKRLLGVWGVKLKGGGGPVRQSLQGRRRGQSCRANGKHRIEPKVGSKSEDDEGTQSGGIGGNWDGSVGIKIACEGGVLNELATDEIHTTSHNTQHETHTT